jgi:hypothetical protein
MNTPNEEQPQAVVTLLECAHAVGATQVAEASAKEASKRQEKDCQSKLAIFEDAEESFLQAEVLVAQAQLQAFSCRRKLHQHDQTERSLLEVVRQLRIELRTAASSADDVIIATARKFGDACQTYTEFCKLKSAIGKDLVSKNEAVTEAKQRAREAQQKRGTAMQKLESARTALYSSLRPSLGATKSPFELGIALIKAANAMTGTRDPFEPRTYKDIFAGPVAEGAPPDSSRAAADE